VKSSRRFALLDDHGTPLGDFENVRDALKAFDVLIGSDPAAAAECFVAEFDTEGRRVGTYAPDDTNQGQGWFVVGRPDPTPYAFRKTVVQGKVARGTGR
jgi:hypothetical protein